MKLSLLALTFVMILSQAVVRADGADPSADAQPNLAVLKQQYEDALVPIGADSLARQEKLKAEYGSALAELQKTVMAAGDLDGALAVNAEIERAESDVEPTGDERSQMPARLRALRDTYQKGRAKIATDRARREQTLASQFATNLGVLEKKLTAQGDLAAALEVREEKERLKMAAPASDTPVERVDDVEPWARQWTIEDNWTEPGQPMNPGTVLSNVWAAGEMVPGQYRNVPFYEGAGKRTGILGLHPATPDRPARLRRECTIDPAKPVLQVIAGGNAIGDCLLQCFVGGEKAGEYVLTGAGWSTCDFDLSRAVGRKSSVELRVAPGGKNAWYFEHGFIDEISFVAKNAQGAR